MNLARYVFVAGRYDFGPRRLASARAAIAIAPLFFVGGRFTGFPAVVSPTWLAQRGVGYRAHGHSHSKGTSLAVDAIRELRDNGLLRLERRQGGLRVAQVHHLEPVERWAWAPDELARVEADWALAAGDSWEGHGVVAEVLAPLVAAHPEVSWTPQDPAMLHFVEVAANLAEQFGLDTLRQAIAAAVDDPSAVLPFDALRFRDAFYGLVRRARKLGLAA